MRLLTCSGCILLFTLWQLVCNQSETEWGQVGKYSLFVLIWQLTAVKIENLLQICCCLYTQNKQKFTLTVYNSVQPVRQKYEGEILNFLHKWWHNCGGRRRGCRMTIQLRQPRFTTGRWTEYNQMSPLLEKDVMSCAEKHSVTQTDCKMLEICLLTNEEAVIWKPSPIYVRVIIVSPSQTAVTWRGCLPPGDLFSPCVKKIFGIKVEIFSVTRWKTFSFHIPS